MSVHVIILKVPFVMKKLDFVAVMLDTILTWTGLSVYHVRIYLFFYKTILHNPIINLLQLQVIMVTHVKTNLNVFC